MIYGKFYSKMRKFFCCLDEYEFYDFEGEGCR